MFSCPSSTMEIGRDPDLEEPCPVCGDKVSGYHYGLLTCESCKGFFKRTVQNNKKYVCAENQECRIDKTQRKRCPFCRFQKCLHVGMRLEAVRADRMRGGRNKFGPMYKRDRALKQQRRALIQAGGFRLERGPPLVCSPHRGDLPFAAGPRPDPVVHPLPPAGWPGPAQLQRSSLSHCSVKSEQACAGPPGRPPPPLVTEFLLCDPDEPRLRRAVAARLRQEQAGRRRRGDLGAFGLACLVADQTLFAIVEWARASAFFKQLKLSDQMKLLHSCWSELLLLDIISRQVLYGQKGSLLLVSGQEVQLADIASHASPTLAGLVQRGQELVERLHVLKVDRQEFACIKFLLLFNPDVKDLEEPQLVEGVQERAERALLEYTGCCRASPHHPGRFAHLLPCLSELRCLGAHAEDHLYGRHLGGEVPCDSLLIEMLLAKRSWA